VAVNANPANRCSSMTSTTRVTSRTLEYDSRPSRNSEVMLGIRRSALATRTCSRAAPGDIEQAHDSQCATDLTSVQNRIALLASNSPTNSNRVHVDRAVWAAAAQIRPAKPSACALSFW